MSADSNSCEVKGAIGIIPLEHPTILFRDPSLKRILQFAWPKAGAMSYRPCLRVIFSSFLVSAMLLVGQSLANFVQSVSWQAWCLQSESCWPEAQCVSSAYQITSETEGTWPICLDDFPKKCLVYSVGVADDWSFDKLMGSLGCQVHSFDPTVDLPEALAPNVTFHQWGLSGGADSGSEKVIQSRSGRQFGPLFSLKEMMEKLHHRHLTVLKIDCEGCEWDFFANIKHHKSLLPDQLAVEFHFSKWFGISNFSRFQQIGDAFQVLAEEGFERVHYHQNGGPEYSEMSEAALLAGFPAEKCCREIIFKRSSASRSPQRPSKAIFHSSTLR